ncbi:alpha/beta fold hydrolase [Plantibacter sp. YIM 135347]|uniref:alpha/beta fold hydrolase n=1 Tax=Plantibacter sp. YIM 135347 TaxID=3423919 RepID=UPI003D34DA88
MTAVTLPRTIWGDASATRTALVVHGLGSNGPSTWRIGTDLAERGWHVTAVDLRGHGFAPRTHDYRVEAYAEDLAATRPDGGGVWDLVVGHSLGGAASAVASASDPSWTRKLVLIDPAILLDDRDATIIRASQEASFADNTIESVRAKNPAWHDQDVELKVQAVSQASRWAIEQTSEQNQPWDVRSQTADIGVPTFVIAADPAVHSLFTGAVAAEVLANNPKLSMTVIVGAGHNVQRERPTETMKAIAEWAELPVR